MIQRLVSIINSVFLQGPIPNTSDFAVFYSNGAIDFTDVPFSARPVSCRITNTTFAALSMRDGDAFAKQFGSSMDANGEDDGTNGEDFFKVTFVSVMQLAIHLDKLNISWQITDLLIITRITFQHRGETVDLTGLFENNEEIAFITFDFESSDVGGFGMNTPAYFAIDDFTYENVAGVNTNALNNFLLYPNPAIDYVTLPEHNGVVSVYNMQGQLIINRTFVANEKMNVRDLKSGVYSVVIETENDPITVKLTK